jgi:hypothetical protein
MIEFILGIRTPLSTTLIPWNPVVQEGVPKTVVTFAALDCIPCPHQQQCTTAKSNRRQLSLHPQQMVQALRTARAQQQTKDWNTDYALCAGVEGTIRQALAVTGLRRPATAAWQRPTSNTSTAPSHST